VTYNLRVVTFRIKTVCFTSLVAAIVINATANPYLVITNRNAFGLKPEQTAPKQEEIRTPPAKVKLEGVMNLMGKRQAILRVSKQGVPPGQEPVLILGEGERDQDIEVISINDEAGEVKIKNAGVVSTITFEKQSTGPGLAPGNISLPTPTIANIPSRPNPILSTQAPAVHAPSPVPVPQQMRSIPPGTTQPTMPSTAVNPGQPIASTTPIRPPTIQRQIRTEERPLSYEEQIILTEIERIRTKEQVERGELPPLPPTELTPPEELEKILAKPQQGAIPPIPQR